jgi:hypothetical protein
MNLELAWFGRADRIDPLDVLRQALAALEAGEPVPASAALPLAQALRRYLDGSETDLTRSLGLRPRRGGAAELPARLERRRERDQLIGAAFDHLPGADTRKAEKLAQLLAAPAPPADPITEADLFRAIEELHARHGCDLPSSGRQILRVVRGETVSARRQTG